MTFTPAVAAVMVFLCGKPVGIADEGLGQVSGYSYLREPLTMDWSGE